MDKKTTKRILKQARLQQQQLEDELEEQEEEDGAPRNRRGKKGLVKAVKLQGRPGDDDGEDSDEDEFALVSGDEDEDPNKFSKEIVSLLILSVALL